MLGVCAQCERVFLSSHFCSLFFTFFTVYGMVLCLYIGCIRKAKGASSQVEEQITFAHAIWFRAEEEKEK